MEQIEIPSPSSDDSETVSTALETAAVFVQKGDMAEAARWLKRAADSAGETANDARTLLLARTAAELNQRLKEPIGVTSEQPLQRELPKVPSRTGSARPAPPSERAGVRPLSLSSRPVPSPPRNMHRVASRPTGSTEPPSASGQAPVPSTNGAGPTNHLFAEAANATATPMITGRNELALKDVHSRDTLASPVPASVLAAASTPAPPMATATPTPAPSAAPSRASQTPAYVRAAAERQTEPVALRQAARVSVVPSATEKGLFLVRLLENDRPAPSEGAEAFLVLVDAKAGILT